MTLVLGGARSGKSRHAEALLTALPPPWLYVATGRPGTTRCATASPGTARRGHSGWRTDEVPLALAAALDDAGALPVLVDCLTLWLSNLLLGGHDVGVASDALLAALERRAAAHRAGGAARSDSGSCRRTRSAAASATRPGCCTSASRTHAGSVRLVVAGLAMHVKP